MQLILDTEATADISVKMSTVEDTLDINFKDSIESLKSDICNGNKENVECQNNTSSKPVNDTDGDHKENTESHLEIPSTIQDTNSKLDIDNDKKLESTANSVNLQLEINTDSARQLEPSNGNSYENTNGVSNTEIVNGDDKKCVENVDLPESKGEDQTVLVNDTVNQETEVVVSSNGETCENTEVQSESENSTKTEDESISDELETKVLNILDAEVNNATTDVDMTETLMEADEVDEDNSGIALGVDKAISEMDVLIHEYTLDDADDEDDSVMTALQNEVQNDNDVLNCDTPINCENSIDLELDKIVESKAETALNVASKDFELEESETESAGIDDKVNNIQIKNALPEVLELNTNSVCEKTNTLESDTVHLVALKTETDTKMTTNNSDVNKAETSVLHSTLSTDQTDNDTKVKGKSDVENIDDDVIQIESEQDSKIIDDGIQETDKSCEDDPKTNVEDEVQIVADESKPTTDEASPKSDTKRDSGLDTKKNDKVCKEVLDDKEELLDDCEMKEVAEDKKQIEGSKEPVKVTEPIPSVLKLSNTLDILSDDEDDQPSTETQKTAASAPTEKDIVNEEDDDDVMLVDEDSNVSKDSKTTPVESMETEEKKEASSAPECTIDLDNEEAVENKKAEEAVPVPEPEKDPAVNISEVKSPAKDPESTEINNEFKKDAKEQLKPLLPENFLKSCKKNLADMTREELEEFCILKIVESIVDRSSLGEIKSKLKSLTQNIEEQKNKALMLTKQNRDLQLVLKSVQEEQKKKPDSVITPLKITRSVGMQVLMTEKVGARKKSNNVAPLAPPNVNRNVRPIQNPRLQKPASNQQIPVPRLVPATANPVAKSPVAQNTPNNNQMKPANHFNSSPRMSPPVQKAEKRPHNRIQSVTVDLTDDEPPAKAPPRNSPAPPVRLVSSQNLLATPRSQATSVNSPRKVYIPISGPQGTNIRPGQTIMLKSVPQPGPRQRAIGPNTIRGPAPNNTVKRMPNNRHPAPLPDATKQYQPPNWKALPPAPDLKLSKVENGIVISWKIEGYQEDSYEEIASYQLYAYQETSSPPNTNLWKKIGDVKALPLPMACTLTQFMAGYKYYFAVRAVDVRSRLGPFSLPGSILLLNKM